MVLGLDGRMKRTEFEVLLVSRAGTILFLVGLAILSGGCNTDRQDPAPRARVPSIYPLMSPGTQFAEVPPPVQPTIRAETGGPQITYIKKATKKNQPVYRVQFANPFFSPPLYVASDGSVLNP